VKNEEQETKFNARNKGGGGGDRKKVQKAMCRKGIREILWETGDSFKGRNKEQETRCSDCRSDRKLSGMQYISKTGDKSKGRNKEQEPMKGTNYEQKTKCNA
jgi:hypothetical protein